MSNSSICSIDKTQSSTTTPSQCGPGSNGDEGVVSILQSSTITGIAILFSQQNWTLVILQKNTKAKIKYDKIRERNLKFV